MMTLDLISEMTPPTYTYYPHRYATISVAQIIFSIQVTCFVAQTTPSNPIFHICHRNVIFPFHELSNYLISDSGADD